MGPAALARVLRPLTLQSHPALLVGLQTSDDAAVYRLSPDLAIIQTVDFFPPVVDDPWTYGAIAAANAMSDVYAMGGDVLLALNIAAFPETLSPDVLIAIFEGGAAKVTEAGGIIAGGHTITDDEPKYGLAVTGTIHPDRVLTKAGAKIGDRLYLTKPLGTGLITTALKQGTASPAEIESAVATMLTLNRNASNVARQVGTINACTDVTGFGLLGHAAEIAAKSNVGLRIWADQVPRLPGALEHAGRGAIAGGLERNRAYFREAEGGIQISERVSPDLETLLFDPQTSGGLLLTVPEARGSALEAAFAASQLPLWRIGEVVAGAGIDVEP